MTVQLAPIARVAPHVPPAAPAGRENGCGVPPPNVNAPPARAVLPVFVTVKVSAELAIAVGQVPKASEPGATEAVRTAGMPVPLNEIGDPFTLAPAVMLTVPPYIWAEVGLKTTLMVQVAFAARVTPQVPPAAPPGREKPAGKAPTAIPVAVATPSLRSVRV